MIEIPQPAMALNDTFKQEQIVEMSQPTSVAEIAALLNSATSVFTDELLEAVQTAGNHHRAKFDDHLRSKNVHIPPGVRLTLGDEGQHQENTIVGSLRTKICVCVPTAPGRCIWVCVYAEQIAS